MKASDAGQLRATYELGRCYELGIGVVENLLTAKKHYEHAARGGLDLARAALGSVERAIDAEKAVSKEKQTEADAKALRREKKRAKAAEAEAAAVKKKADEEIAAAKRQAAEAIEALRREQSSALPATKIIRSAELSPPIAEARKLGEGAFGAVYAMKQHLYIDVAVKVLHVGAHDAAAIELFEREAALHASLADERIVMFKGVVLDASQLQIVMPLMTCSVWDAIHKLDCVHHALVRDASARAQICVEIALGLLYLHGLSIIHRDLKSANVLLDRAGAAKLVDFGLARIKKHANTLTAATTDKALVGTVHWMAPEILDPDDPKFSPPIDIYALGVTAWELAALKQPFENAANATLIVVKVLQGGRPAMPDDVPAPFRSAIEACWAQEATQRPSASDAVALFALANSATAPTAPPPSVFRQK